MGCGATQSFQFVKRGFAKCDSELRNLLITIQMEGMGCEWILNLGLSYVSSNEHLLILNLVFSLRITYNNFI